MRRLSIKYPPRLKAVKESQTVVIIGTTKTGKPIKRVTYTCKQCNTSGLKNYVRNKQKIIEWNMDHIIPMADETGYGENWNNIIEGLFTPYENWQCLCVSCHDIKSAGENQARFLFDKKNK